MLLKGSSLITWDEATMAHHTLDAVDRLLKDLIGNDSPFGDKVTLLG